MVVNKNTLMKSATILSRLESEATTRLIRSNASLNCLVFSKSLASASFLSEISLVIIEICLIKPYK